MDITFLGTGVGEYDPASAGYRANTCTLFGDVLVDTPPTLQASLDRAGRAHSEVRCVVYTHAHSDHFDEAALRGLLQAGTVAGIGVPAWLAGRVISIVEDGAQDCEVVALSPYEEVELCGAVVFPLEANHWTESPDQVNLNYQFEFGDTRILYLVDSGLPFYSTVRELERRRRPADMLIMEATSVLQDGGGLMFVHSSLQGVARLAQSWRQSGILTQDAVVLTTHFGAEAVKKGLPTEGQLAELGLQMAEDGMVAEMV